MSTYQRQLVVEVERRTDGARVELVDIGGELPRPGLSADGGRRGDQGAAPPPSSAV